MGTTWPEKSSTNRKKLIEELVRGREFAAQLQIVLRKPFGDYGSLSPEELAVNILRSFTESLSVLSSSESGEVCQNPATSQVGSPCRDDREDSGESRKRLGLKDRRGAYKRRKTSQTWTIVSPSIEDGFAWRKYGQKEILNAKYPRSYFRCTRKQERGCRATKQVQRIEEEEHMYRTTYIGHHTCKDTVKQIISDSDPDPDQESYLIDFDSKIPIKHDHPSSTSVKKEYKDDSILLPNSMAFESSCPDAVVWPPEMGSDSGDVGSAGVYSCTATSNRHSLDIDFMVGSIDCDNYFNFDETLEF